MGRFVPMTQEEKSTPWNRFRYWLMSRLLPGGGLAGVAKLVGTHYEIISIIYRLLPIGVFFLSSFSSNEIRSNHSIAFNEIASASKVDLDLQAECIYEALNTNNLELPKLESFTKAVKGFYELKEKGLVNSIEDENDEELFFLTEKGKKVMKENDDKLI